MTGERHPNSGQFVATVLVGAVLLALPVAFGSIGSGAARPVTGGVGHFTDWPTYLGNVARESDAFGETTINVSSAGHLAQLWNFTTGGEVVGSAAIVGNVVYVGSWDGYEYALNATTGHKLWSTFLGQDTYGYRTTGITSSPMVVKGTLYVGGGGPDWFALNTANGSVRWKVPVSNLSAGFYNWASPLIVGGMAYIGLSSKGDNPLVRGGVVELSLSTHRVLHTFYTTANGTIGASVWTSPAYDAGTKTVFVTTGNPGPNGSTWAESLLAFNATTLNLTGHWTVPPAQAPLDSDFGATPMLYAPAPGRTFVAASNKNDHFYVWNASGVGAGPIWNRTTSIAPSAKGSPNLGPAAWGGGLLYVAASLSKIHGVVQNGSLHAYTQATGQLVWQKGEPGPVLGAPVYADGTLVAVSGHDLTVLNATNGAQLFRFVSNGTFVGPPALGHGEIVEGATNGVVYALAPKAGPTLPGHAEGRGADLAPSIGDVLAARRAASDGSQW